MKRLISYLSGAASGLWLSALPVLAQTSSNPSLSNAPGVDITIESLYGIFQGLACWGSRFIIIIMVGMIVWYGFQMITAGSDSGKFAAARKSLGYAVAGMVVVFGAYTLIATVENAVQSLGTGYAVGPYGVSVSVSVNIFSYTPIACAGF